MKKVAIKCTGPEQGARIIEYLVGLGGDNKHNRDGSAVGAFYYMRESGIIDWTYRCPYGYTEIKLPATPEIGPEGKLMWVWDEGDNNPKCRKRIVLWINESECIAVFSGDEESFLKRNSFTVWRWKHCAEIIEPEQVELTMEEVCQKLGMNVKIVKK